MSSSSQEGKKAKGWKKKALSYGGQFLLVIALLWGVTEWQARSLLSRDATAPNFVLPSLDGEEISLEAARGKTVVLYFFAPWCSVCRYSSHNIVALRNARDEDDLTIYAVGLGWERRSDIESFAREHELNVPVLLGDNAVHHQYNIGAFPTIYIIDEEGRVSDRVIGYTTELGLRLRSL